MKAFVISFIVATCSIGFVTPTTPYLTCIDAPLVGPAPLSVTINDCNKLPCTISKDSPVNVEVTFTAVNNATTLFGIVFADNKGISLGGDVIDDVCNHLTEGSCPVRDGERVTLSFTTDPARFPLGTDASAEVVVFDNTYSVLHTCHVYSNFIRQSSSAHICQRSVKNL